MKIKRKSWLWNLTVFAGTQCSTAWNDTVYLAKGVDINDKKVIAHETIHIQQQNAIGKWKFLFFYLFCFPFIYNPWRWEFEAEAYRHADCIGYDEIEKILGSWRYGWLRKAY